MIVFWIGAALLLALALLFLLPPLLRRQAAPGASAAQGANVAVYRDQLREAERDLAADLITPERFAQTQAEIERRVLEDTASAQAAADARPSRATAWLLLLLVPLASVGTYLATGEPGAVDPRAALAAADPQNQHEIGNEQIERMVAALADRLKAQPDDVQGWSMLGRSYSAMGRYDDAVAALRRAVALEPRSADRLADLADALGMAQGRKLAGEPLKLVQQALEADPRHLKALALAGSAAFEAQDYAAAQALWQRLLAVAPAESELAQSVRGGVAEAARLAASAATPPAATSPAATSPAAAGRERISGQVLLDPQLAARVAPADTLFVYARPADGPRMPLAIVRRQAGELPLRFELDDSQAMSPAARLSGHAQVFVEARISKSGQATPQSGDLVGQVGPVALGTRELKITIDRLQP